MEGSLYAKILRSEVRHARILRYDLSKAEALLGVVAIVGPNDVPGTPYLPNCQPQVYIFPKDKIRFKGEVCKRLNKINLLAGNRRTVVGRIQLEGHPVHGGDL